MDTQLDKAHLYDCRFCPLSKHVCILNSKSSEALRVMVSVQETVGSSAKMGSKGTNCPFLYPRSRLVSRPKGFAVVAAFLLYSI